MNNAALGIRASVVSTDSGPLLQFTSVATGAAGAFTINGLDTAPQTLVAAQDAQIAVGDPAAGGYTVSSSTNTFNNVIPGVTFSIGAVATGVTVSVSSDASAISDKVKALVDAANAALTELGKDTGKGAVLESNYQINSITDSVLSTVSRGSSGTSFASVGVQLTSTGSLAFDATAFASAYATDPAKAQATVATSLAGALSTLAMNSSTQIVSPLINSGTSQIGAAEQADRRLGHPAGQPADRHADQVRRDGGGVAEAAVHLQLPDLGAGRDQQVQLLLRQLVAPNQPAATSRRRR